MRVREGDTQGLDAQHRSSSSTRCSRRTGASAGCSRALIPMLDERRRVNGVGSARASDVSRRKRVEQELQLSEERLRDADRRKDEFLATLAHEAAQSAGADPATPSDLLGLLAGRAHRQGARDPRPAGEPHGAPRRRPAGGLRISRGRITLQREHVRLGRVIDAAIEASLPGHRARGPPAHGDGGARERLGACRSGAPGPGVREPAQQRRPLHACLRTSSCRWPARATTWRSPWPTTASASPPSSCPGCSRCSRRWIPVPATRRAASASASACRAG